MCKIISVCFRAVFSGCDLVYVTYNMFCFMSPQVCKRWGIPKKLYLHLQNRGTTPLEIGFIPQNTWPFMCRCAVKNLDTHSPLQAASSTSSLTCSCLTVILFVWGSAVKVADCSLQLTVCQLAISCV